MKWLMLAMVCAAVGTALSRDCGPCDEQKCRVPRDCEAGLVKDACDCCYVCAMREGQPCDDEYKCGDDLACRYREDYPAEEAKQTVCFCKHEEVLCGENGKTYKNLCELMEESYRNHEKVKIAKRGPCATAPWIATPPTDVLDLSGDDIILTCEAMGYPIPLVEWSFTSASGEVVYLPKDDDHIAVQARGGPEQFEVTSWVQIHGVRASDEGTYACHAQNELGTAEAAARVRLSHRND
ncbi:PREDICTED: insulin-like growth factor-binding protein-related protein 1 [Priapulus caudatus]|uniref:Insulin-like growth factor-binding protein-related protein 1 n=1 Tax=Priapulus caudatus TaxID=37621 RepID=A0ABM1E436_PRICU|nr:PREDICTED: insulin-like growth factor-binding protein-related protein 1 [Priapulus caudatus]XP_014666958.1 PREDICTED: insulin-like growth factor-binding protein-related protein 1 [Priapulus caudatus]XP_014666959.1 PREDICTED: insulin-like growth factor-binding protein-related protein 1 [Priapulus caudatus]XP_014666960.1 PREDICTED: insulin-like growth factor-binding protein-related protein 1 [Priapulus caudatus]